MPCALQTVVDLQDQWGTILALLSRYSSTCDVLRYSDKRDRYSSFPPGVHVKSVDDKYTWTCCVFPPGRNLDTISQRWEAF